MSEYITMRDCLKLDLKDAITQRDNLQDQRDFAMSEMERLKRERDEAREAFAIATNNCADAQQQLRAARDRSWKLGRERNHWKLDCLEQCKLLAMGADREDKLRTDLMLAQKLAESAMLESDRLRAQLHKQ